MDMCTRYSQIREQKDYFEIFILIQYLFFEDSCEYCSYYNYKIVY